MPGMSAFQPIALDHLILKRALEIYNNGHSSGGVFEASQQALKIVIGGNIDAPQNRQLKDWLADQLRRNTIKLVHENEETRGVA